MAQPIVGKYRILVQIGEGYSSGLYLAEDTSLNRKVALKLSPHSPATAGCSQAFQREAWRSAALNHPNVATVFDVGTDGTLDYLASEWSPAGTLRQKLRKGALPVEETLDIAIAIARALKASHEAWFVHREVRPENILLRTPRDSAGFDFDIAALLGGGEDVDPLTNPRRPAGVINYLSPEQVRGDSIIDSRSDIYSLGVVVYEMLSGQTPFNERATLDLLAMIVETPPPLLDKSVPFALRSIVERSLRKEIHERHQTAEELLDELMAVRLELEVEKRNRKKLELN